MTRNETVGDGDHVLKIFVCYRRSEEVDAVNLIWQNLAHEFGRDNVFRDIHGLEGGVEWRLELTRKVKQCDVMLVITTDHWLMLQDEKGRRRIDGDEDFVRFEIKNAFDNDVYVIPLLINKASEPNKTWDLKEDIAKLYELHCVRYRSTDFQHDIAALIDLLKRYETNARVVREATRKLEAAIEQGDWIVAGDVAKGAGEHDNEENRAHHRRSDRTRHLALRLAAVSQAFGRGDFADAAGLLDDLTGQSDIQIVQLALAVARLGERLTSPDPALQPNVVAIEAELSAIRGCEAAAGVTIPGERELRQTLGRIRKEQDYRDALRHYQAVDFAAAASAFDGLGDYKDSVDRLGRARNWLAVIDYMRQRNWDAARRELSALAPKSDERYARPALRWCLFAKRVVPCLEALAQGLVTEPNVPWEGGLSPYVVLELEPTVTADFCRDRLLYELQERPGGATHEQRECIDALRLVGRRLLVDFGLYAVRNPGRAKRLLESHFAMENPAEALERLLRAVQRAEHDDPSVQRSLYDQIADELPEDDGVFRAAGREYDAAIGSFVAQARQNPHEGLHLHHLGLAACAKASLEPDGEATSDAWELARAAWAAIFADNRFWRAWWSQRRKICPGISEEQIDAARTSITHYWQEVLHTITSAVGDVFATELASARAAAALGGVPTGKSARHRAIVGRRGLALLRIDAAFAQWVAQLAARIEASGSKELELCIAFSSLCGPRILLETDRHEEALAALESTEHAGDDRFAEANSGFAYLPGQAATRLFEIARQELALEAHTKSALAAISQVPVGIERAIEHWQQALALGERLGFQSKIFDELRSVIIGRSRALRGQTGTGRLDALDDAVKMLQVAFDRNWDGDENGIREELVNALTDRAVFVCNQYEEREARQDALRATALAPNAVWPALVLCRVSHNYAVLLRNNGKPERAQALVREVEERLAAAESLFSDNTEVAALRRETAALKATLVDAPDTKTALKRLSEATEYARGDALEDPLQEALVLEAQDKFAEAVMAYQRAIAERPQDRGLRGRLAMAYERWLNRVRKQGEDDEYQRLLAEARERCPESEALRDLSEPLPTAVRG